VGLREEQSSEQKDLLCFSRERGTDLTVELQGRGPHPTRTQGCWLGRVLLQQLRTTCPGASAQPSQPAQPLGSTHVGEQPHDEAG